MSARIIPWPVVPRPVAARPVPPQAPQDQVADHQQAEKSYQPAWVEPERMARFDPPASLLELLNARIKPVTKGLIILECAAAFLFFWIALP